MLAALVPMPADLITERMRFEALAATQAHNGNGISGLGLGVDLSSNGQWPPECDPVQSDAAGECLPWSYTGATPPIRTVSSPGRPTVPAARDTSGDIIKGVPNSYLAAGAAGLVALILISRM